jgi:hypothetical protein
MLKHIGSNLGKENGIPNREAVPTEFTSQNIT